MKTPVAVRALALLAAVLVTLLSGSLALADEAVHIDDAQHGLVVLGLGGSVDTAWPLARAVYAESKLRPPTLDEAHARVLVGEAPGDAASAELRDLADLRAAIHGDDGASRRLLESIALSLHVKGVVVVEAGTANTRPLARVFVTNNKAFDAVRYDPDPQAPSTWGTGLALITWNGAVTALTRGFADAPVAVAALPAPPSPAAPLAVHALAPASAPTAEKGKSRAFYQSPWFWAAAGAALFAAGAVYLATRNDTTSDNIQLQVQVPK